MATAAPSAVSNESEIILRDDNVPPLSEELSRLYSQGFLTDITLSTEDGKNFEAHRVLLAARSHYFHSLVPRLKSEAVIFLKGVKGSILDKILKYIYGGSVGVSKHQVRPILEVAKSLQVKGLMDLHPGNVGKMTSSSSNPPPASQHRFGRVSLGSTFKSPPPLPRRSRFSVNGDHEESSPVSSTPPANNTPSTPKDDSESEEGAPKPKRKRGRPPKTTPSTPSSGGIKEEASSSNKPQRSSGKSAGDPYDFEDEDQASDRKSAAWKTAKKQKKAEEEGDKSQPEEEDSSSQIVPGEEESSPKKDIILKKSSFSAKSVISVRCKGQVAELHIARFASGVRGLSIRHKDSWMTPQSFEASAGCSTKYYLENIQTDYGPLKALTASGILKPHSRKCRCSLCRGEEPVPPPVVVAPPVLPSMEEEGGSGGALDDKGEDSEEEEDDSEDSEDEDDNDSEDEEEKRRMKKREEWSRQLEAKLKSEYGHEDEDEESDDLSLPPQITPQVATHVAPPPPLPPPPPAVTPLTHHTQHQQQQHAAPQILSTSPLVLSTSSSHALVSGAPPSSTYISILDQPPKISPSILPSNGLQTIQTSHHHHHHLTQPERIDTPQTLFVMSSPHPHISAPPTPQHNPFANHLTQQSPSNNMAPTVTMALSLPQSNHHHHHQQQPQVLAAASPQQTRPLTGSRIGSVMQVRCKSTTALLYANKYESGSRGKCIQLGEEWLTPNEFEDRAGSKAKKYLSSIKCLGRPLRVYVNSGELRGSGNASASKILKDKNKVPQPIAPAPPSGLLNGLGGGIHAPPTPTHVSSGGSLPHNLNMMMTAPAQPPILINQTSMGASSLMGGSPSIITGPMTVALGSPPFEVRHSSAM